MLMRLMSKGEYLIVPKGTKFTGAGKLGLRLFAANGQLLAQTYEHLDCDIPLNKYSMHLGWWSKWGKVICPGSQHIGRSGAQTHNLLFMSHALFR